MPVRELLGYTEAASDHPTPGKRHRALQYDQNRLHCTWQKFPYDQGARQVRAGWRTGLRGALPTLIFSLGLLITLLAGRLCAQVPLSEPAPVPSGLPDPLETIPTSPAPPGLADPFETLPTSPERLLAPVPQQFNWLEREAPSNPLLEALLGRQALPGQLNLSVSLTEEVSDNFAHSPSSRRTDTRTGLTLGTVYRLDDGQNFVSLANTVRGFYETRSDRSQIGFANLFLNAGYQMQAWSFGLTERFTRDDATTQDARTPLLRTQQDFIRNSVSPQVRYAFTPRTAATLTYTNTVVVDEDGGQGNATSHAASAGLQHQFSPRLTGNTRYTFTTSQGSGASGGETHRLTTALGYTLDPATSVSLSAFGRLVERQSVGAQDSRTYGAAVGVRRVLFASVSLSASAGPTVFKREGDDERLRANWDVSLDGPIPIFASRAWTLTVLTRQNVQDTAGEVNDVGLVLRQSVIARLNYTPSIAFAGLLFAEYTRNELLEEVDTAGAARGRKDNFWSTGVTASYALTRIISFTGTYRYQQRDSNLSNNDFTENRVTVAVTGTFPVF